MATFATATLSHPATGLRALFARLLARRAERRAMARTLRDLNNMESRDLHDLGISHYDFEAIAQGVYKR